MGGDEGLVARLAALVGGGDPSVLAALEHELGCDELLVFMPDPELGIYLPAPGFPQTLPEGAWCPVMKACQQAEVGVWVDALLPTTRITGIVPAIAARATGDAVLVCIGGVPQRDVAARVLALLPLVAAGLRRTQLATIAQARAETAKVTATQIRTLAEALESSRSELDAQRLQLVEALRVKDEFLAMLGHELRNPLAPIVLALELLEARSGGALPPEYETIARQVAHATRLVEDLLDVSRIARGAIELTCKPVELYAVVVRAAEMAAPILARFGHRLLVDVPVSGLVLLLDTDRMTQVLTNLIVNAARHSERDRTIRLAADSAPSEVALRVIDQGFGIAEADRDRIFERFVQGATPTRRPGLGLGLAICRSLVAAHGGKIWVESDGLGTGSTFIVSLPRTSMASTTVESIVNSVPRAKRIEKRGRLLVVDDNTDAGMMLAAALTLNGFETKTASDGPSALELVDQFAPDIAVIDIGLPGMDGCELASRLRVRAQGTRLIALSGFGQDVNRERALAAGFEAYVVKPAQVTQLLEVIGPAR